MQTIRIDSKHRPGITVAVGRTRAELDGVKISLLPLADLKTNKQASGRLLDLADLENLP